MTNVIKVFSELIKPSLIEEEWRYLAFFLGIMLKLFLKCH